MEIEEEPGKVREGQSGGRVELLVATLEQAYRRKAWHGATLRGALSRVDAAMAAWRPAPGRPSVWEIAVHCAYWKHNVWRRVAPEGAVGPFPLGGSNWYRRSEAEPSERAWKADLELLRVMHEGLVTAAAALDDHDLARIPGRGTTSIEDLLRGAAFHDVHHGGQVQLLKRLRKATARP